MLAIDQEWSKCFALQALSDLDVRDELAKANAEKCHRLHYLQMAAEKTCKAYIIKTEGYKDFRSHAVVSKYLPVIARWSYGQFVSDTHGIAAWQLAEIRKLAAEIELIAPACHANKSRLDNSEYPWPDGSGNVKAPCTYQFPNLDDGSRAAALLIRLMRAASEAYSR